MKTKSPAVTAGTKPDHTGAVTCGVATRLGSRPLPGTTESSDAEMSAFETSLQLPAVHRAQAGLISDMDYIADVLYARAAKPALAA